MKDEKFKLYLSKKYTNSRVIGDAISRCKRVAQGKFLLDRLSYSKKDAELQIEPRHTIDIKGTKGYVSIYEGTLSLYRELYFDYKKSNIY